ncbi:hypothetical protein AGABI1DRAFT_110405 [Agaricus bisporus var. burnettii JB137-S8]|uniref:Uncharacterized protein n=1 Tax=Agaricus bisporus var. burnettii (strain JB137-S8 / ATCC MYA-4627 / FGSC 10392) TaxID=597362 RepID=K5XJU7_AGABU|nr:uncharacterized protein AGABI1DRAFT_110405 [Agaricus bisporus var. burnettii JB137-S8]EKM83803.1 hypothetical protein AGABI1DRAFT_110405 [Agaricus bisporus var. burnettii JB137-S8]
MSDSPALSYNVRWVTRTFSSRAKVEALLGPEHSAGSISSHDYDAALSFFPGFHNYYGIILSTATLAAVYVFRKPSWSRLRFWGVATGTSFGSLALGNALTLKSHFDFVRSLNNPAGFAEAMERIQKQSGLQQPHGPVIQRKYNIEEGLHGNVEQHQDLVSTEPEPLQQQTAPVQQGRSSSKWDQIRASNAAASPSSTWDALRQKQQKSQPQKPQNDTPRRNENASDDQTIDQAQFDALLDKERNVGSQNFRE